MRATSFPVFAAPGVLAIAIFLAYLFVWLAGARQMREAVEDWATDQRESGREASIGRFKATGFPFFLRGALTDVKVASGKWRLETPRVFIDAQPLSPSRFIVSTREPFIVDFGGEGEWRVEAPGARASISRDKEREWRLDVEAGPSRLARIDREGTVVASSFLLSAAPNNIDRTRIFIGLSATAIEFAEPGREVDLDAIDLAIAIAGATEQATSLRSWRDGGGAVDIQNAAATKGTARAQISGTVAIDADGYPAGRLEAAIGDPASFVEALAAVGVLRATDVDNARAALSLIAIASGGKIVAPFVLEDGEATIAGVRIGKLKPVFNDEPPPQP